MKSKHFFSLCIIVATVLIHTSLRAQPFDSLLNKLNTRYPQEKLYLQFDRSMYNPGETIWFKAYLFSGLLPSAISKTIYFDLLNADGKLLQRKTSPVLSSSAAAAFDLPATLSGSLVYVRAYTKWMLNFDSSFIYTKPIPIVTSKETARKKTAPPAAFIQFFPEGGDLVEGVNSRVAFKATDAHGLPLNVSGDVLNAAGKKVVSFSTLHDGMGYFRIIPDAGQQYKVSWKERTGPARQALLPSAKKTGVVLEAGASANGIRFSVKRPEDAAAAFPFVYVVAQFQQQLLYRGKADLAKTSLISGLIPTEALPSGIIQVTIFDANDRPLAERIVFVNKQDYYFITDINSPLKGLTPKARNVIQIDVPDTLSCNLSVAVTDAATETSQENEDNIFSHVLLTSDIRGYVHDPAYYFSSDADSVQAHLDLVMMTNGWRRFKWEEVLANHWPSIRYMPENYVTLEGKINGLNKGELIGKDLTAIFALRNGSQQFFTIPLHNSNLFSVPGLVFYDTARLFYQFNNDKDKVLTSRALVDIKNNMVNGAIQVPSDSSWTFRLMRPDTATVARNRQMAAKRLEEEESRLKVKTLESVTVTAKQPSRQEKMDQEYTSGLFRGGDGYTFITEDDRLATASQTVLQYLQGKVAGLQIITNGSQSSLSWRGGAPALYLNEMQGDVSMIQNIAMNDVAMVKVFRPPFFGAFGGGSNGAIAVYTKKGRSNNENIKGLDFVKVTGYSPVKEFYSPDYAKYDPANSQPDYRTTLYWNPFVTTDATHRRILLTFYNNDVTKKLRVVVEGMNEEGRLTRMERIVQ